MFVAKQPGFSGFAYDFLDATHRKVGALRWPDVAVATNARLKDLYPEALNKRFEIEMGSQKFEIEFEYLNRAWNNDIEFRLKNHMDVLASAAVLQPRHPLRRLPPIRVQKPFEGELFSRGGIFRVCYGVTRSGESVGSIFEKRVFSVKRQLVIDLSDTIPAPVQFFLFFLVCNRSFR